MTLLQNWEHRANAFDQGNDREELLRPAASFVVTADHDPGRDDGGPLGWRFCRSGPEVVHDYPEPTWRTRMRHNTKNIGGGASDVVQLAG
jgi:hypothetical protein